VVQGYDDDDDYYYYKCKEFSDIIAKMLQGHCTERSPRSVGKSGKRNSKVLCVSVK